MYCYVRFLSVVISQNVLHFGRLVMRLAKGDVAVHQYVQLYGVVVAQSACAQLMGLNHTWYRCCQS